MFRVLGYYRLESRYGGDKEANSSPQPPRQEYKVLVRSKPKVVPIPRATEWIITFVLLGFSAVLAIPGNTIERTNLVVLETWGFTEFWISAIYGSCGLLRLSALIINGYSTPITARVRVFTAMVSAVLWMNLTMIVYYVVLTNWQVATIGMVTWPAFAAMDFVAIARAWRDAKYNPT